MMAITVSSSIMVKPARLPERPFIGIILPRADLPARRPLPVV
jgi:hypothetical protein